MSQLAAEHQGAGRGRAARVQRRALLRRREGRDAVGDCRSGAASLPMMADRRVVMVMRAEKLLKPKRRGKGAQAEAEDDADAEAPTELDVLEAYVKQPEPQTTLVLVAADVDRTRRLYKTLLKQGTIVECWGLKGSK